MKLRKLFTSLICAVIAFTMAFPVYAEQDTANPCGLATQCPKCFGVADVRKTKKFLREEHPLCTHIWEDHGAVPGIGDGRDHYEVYEVTYEENCRSCSFSYTSTREVKELISCDYDYVR